MPGDGDDRKSCRTALLDVLESFVAINSDDGRWWVQMPLPPQGSGRKATVALESKRFQSAVMAQYYRLYGTVADANSLRDAIETWKGLHEDAEGEQPEVAMRVAGGADGRVYLDLGDDEHVVTVTPGVGWSVGQLDDPHIVFRREPGYLPLPMPMRGGSVAMLRPFVNTGWRHPEDGWQSAQGAGQWDGDHVWVRMVLWLLQALSPDGDYPVLVLNGARGSGKSTVSRYLRGIIDPAIADLEDEPTSANDVLMRADTCWVVAFDNLSKLERRVSDALCRLSTGSATTKRKLYTDNDRLSFKAKRPSIINGITNLATKEDIQTRALTVSLPPIEADARTTVSVMDAAYEQVRPYVLGALLDALVVALAGKPAVHARLTSNIRLGDMVELGIAGETALGWPEGTVEQAVREMTGEASDFAVQQSIIGALVMDYLDVLWREQGSSEFYDEVRILRQKLKDLAIEQGTSVGDWRTNFPQRTGAMKQALLSLIPDLNAAGIAVRLTNVANRPMARLTNTHRAMGVALSDLNLPALYDRRFPEQVVRGEVALGDGNGCEQA